MLNSGLHDERVGHQFLIEVLETVLSEKNLVLVLSECRSDALGISLTHCQLLSTVGSGVLMYLSGHTGSAHKAVVDGAELLEIEVRIILVFDLVRKVKIFVYGISHYLFLLNISSCIPRGSSAKTGISRSERVF